MQIILQISGSHLIVGIGGRKQKILEEFFSFQSFGAASQPHFLSDNFLYFWSDYPRLIKAFEAKNESRFYNRTGVTLVSEYARTKLRALAEEQVNNLEHCFFLKTIITQPDIEINEREITEIESSGV